jgi:hypothetical protein
VSDPDLANRFLSTTFLMKRARELEAIQADRSRSVEVRMAALVYAKAIRQELKPC